MWIKEFFGKIFGRKKEELKYPSEFAIIEYSPSALRQNIADEQNKNIYHYIYDPLLERYRLKIYRFSKARLECLQEIRGVPIYDKTKKETRFPVFSKIFPLEIKYTTTE